jgi:hypothetical protein
MDFDERCGHDSSQYFFQDKEFAAGGLEENGSGVCAVACVERVCLKMQEVSVRARRDESESFEREIF